MYTEIGPGNKDLTCPRNKEARSQNAFFQEIILEKRNKIIE